MRAAKFPRDHKFTIGDKWVETCLEVTTLLTEASFVRDKLPLLAQASRARVLRYIAQRLELLTPAQREHFSDGSLPPAAFPTLQPAHTLAASAQLHVSTAKRSIGPLPRC